MRILILSTWFPYPLSQGSKIRAYHLIRGLAQRHEISLLSFEDASLRPEWMAHLQEFCQQVTVVNRDPFAVSRRQSRRGWLSLQPSAVAAGYSPEMAALVRSSEATWHPDVVLALTFVTARYALGTGNACKVVDVDNLLAPMLRETYKQAGSSPARLRRWLAWWKFQRYEKQLFGQFDLCLTVSERDRQRLRRMLPKACTAYTAVVPNGVDISRNGPGQATTPNTLVFNGSMTYEPNRDAMAYFLNDILPLVRAAIPGTRLQITGSSEGVRLAELPLDEGVTLTGYVEDVRAIVAGSSACVVPLRQGAGTRLKILEAMALGTPVVTTTKGAEGLDVVPGTHLLLADDAHDFAEQVITLLRDPLLGQRLAANARQLVEARYSWAEIGQRLCVTLDGARAAMTGYGR